MPLFTVPAPGRGGEKRERGKGGREGGEREMGKGEKGGRDGGGKEERREEKDSRAIESRVYNPHRTPNEPPGCSI